MTEDPNIRHFQQCYEHREDLQKFVALLREKAINVWSKVERRGSRQPFFPGLEIRRKDPKVIQRDRERIVALLDAWVQKLEPRYLDLKKLDLCDKMYGGKYTSVPHAVDVITRRAMLRLDLVLTNAPKYDRDATHFFGDGRLWEGWSLSEYLTTLLYWDDLHCYGVLRRVTSEVGKYGKATAATWLAAIEWINREELQNTVYSRYKKFTQAL